MRSSWTDINALCAAMKGSPLVGHQTHGDLDCGDFVLDALGTHWAGELGSGGYNVPDYFDSEAQNAMRWLYYRKWTEPLYSLCPHPNFGKFFFVVLLIFLLTLVSECSIPLCHVCTLY